MQLVTPQAVCQRNGNCIWSPHSAAQRIETITPLVYERGREIYDCDGDTLLRFRDFGHSEWSVAFCVLDLGNTITLASGTGRFRYCEQNGFT